MSFFENFCATKDDYPQTARYYPKLPKPQKANANGLNEILADNTFYSFTYKNETFKDRSWQAVIPNVMTEGARKSIKTATALKYKSGGFVMTQDGCFYRVEQVLSDDSTDETKETLRLFKKSGSPIFILRLLQVDYKL